MRKLIFFILVSFGVLPFFVSCFWWIRPIGNFKEYEAPKEPNYSFPSSWTALPQTIDQADAVPTASNLKNEQKNALIDVFFIHPTTFFGREWNAYLDDMKVNSRTDNGTIRQQASVFNCCGKIYAPRYRQATLYSFLDKENGRLALDLAYQDILNSFEFYLNNWNQGRPFVIASHSQGTFHAIRLLKEKIDNSPLLEKLVAAYLIGGAVPITIYQTIPACRTADQTGCVISWRTFGENAEIPKLPHDPSPPILCVNPISWKTDEILAEAKDHPGGVNEKFKTIEPRLCNARCLNGVLRISEPQASGFSKMGENYHVLDYGIFYQSIRNNITVRIQHYLQRKKN
ncbi:DUF3089 domain-containing protein [Leptospira sp. WS92.C1]